MSRFGFRTRNGVISSFIEGLVGITTDVDAQAYFDRVTAAGGTLSTTEKDAVNTLTLSLKSTGVWTLMKAIYPMVGASAAACSQNLKSSSFTGTFTSGWTFSSTGVTPNGTSAYMNTSLIPNVSLTLNSSHLSSYIRGTNAGNQIYIGAKGASTTILNYVLNFGYAAINNSDTLATSVSGQVGLFLNVRTSSTNLVQYKNSNALSTLVNTSIGLHEQSIWLGAYNNNTTILFPSNNQCAFASIGDGLSPAQVTDFYNSIQTFQTSLSRQV